MQHTDFPGQIWNAHGLYTTEFSNEIAVFQKFLEDNPSEVVIIDLNGGWYDMDDSLLSKLNSELDV